MKRFLPILMIAVMIGSSFSYAVEGKKEEQKYLTYEKAVEIATKNSLELKKTQKKLDKIKTTEEELDDQSSQLREGLEVPPNADQLMDKVSLGLASAELEKELGKQSIKYTISLMELAIRNLFNQIDFAYDSIKVYEKEIELLKKELSIADIKMKRGLISQYDYNVLKTSLEGMEKSKTQKYLELNKLFLQLNQYLDLKDIETYQFVEIPYEFKSLVLEPEEVKLRGLQASSVNMQVVAKEHGVTMQQLVLNRDLYEGNRAIQQADLYIQQTEILQLKEDIRSGVVREYQNILLLEEKIGLLYRQKEVKVEELENEKIKLLAGKVSAFSLEQKKLELEKLDFQIEEAIKGYETAKIHFYNLYVTGSSM